METNDTLRSCPPCPTPERCLGLRGQCGMALDKILAQREREDSLLAETLFDDEIVGRGTKP